MSHDVSAPMPAGERENPGLRLRVKVRATADARQQLETLAHNALGGSWTVSPLVPRAPRRPAIAPLARYYILTTTTDAQDKWQVSRLGWDAGYRLADAAPALIARAEPDLPHANTGPDPALAPEHIAPELRLGLIGVCDPPSDRPGTDNTNWALQNMRCPQAQALPPDPGGKSLGQGVRVGHPDTGYTDHPELQGLLDLTRDRDVLDNDNDARDPLSSQSPLDSPGHGTLTASVMASRTSGVINGVAPGAKVVPIRTVTSVWANVFDTHVAAAIDWARLHGCHVVSMSLGGLYFEGAEDAINSAVAAGLIVLAAAGNCVPFVVWPAAYLNAIAVAASTIDDTPSSYSSMGTKVAISAPGESVWAATFNRATSPPTPQHSKTTGTSLATAHLAGVAALWLAHYGRQALIATYGIQNLQTVFLHQLVNHGYRRPSGWPTTQYGVGIVDAEALLKAALPSPSMLPTMRSRYAAPEFRPDAVTLIQTVCPELTKDQIEAQLGVLLQAQGPDLDRMREHYGRELLYILSEDPDARAAFIAGPQAYAGVEARATLQEAVGNRASDSLRVELERT